MDQKSCSYPDFSDLYDIKPNESFEMTSYLKLTFWNIVNLTTGLKSYLCHLPAVRFSKIIHIIVLLTNIFFQFHNN